MSDFYTIDDFNFKDKTVFVRVDLNCPIDQKSREFLDDRRIVEHAKTVKELSDKGAKVVVLAHQGRPGDEAEFTTLQKHAERLGKYVGKKVKYVPDILGPTAQSELESLKSGDIILLENVRFLAEENLNRTPAEQAQTLFIKFLAPFVDYFVLDAFATVHRSQPSLVGFTEIKPSLAGRVLEEEVKMLSKAVEAKKHPAIFVTGGAKIKDSIKTIEQFLNRKIVDEVLTCGLVGNIFLAAKGYQVSGIEYIEDYAKLLEKSKKLLGLFPDKILIPEDVAVDKYGQREEIPVSKLPQP